MTFTGSASSFKGDKVPSGYRTGQVAQYNKPQMKLHKQSFGAVEPDSYFGRLAAGDEGMFNEIEAPAMQQFGQLQSGLASRYSQGGGEGGGQQALSSRNSSGFKNEMTAGASNFAQQLQAQRHQLRQGAIGSLHSMTQDLLSNRPYERTLNQKREKQNSGWGGLAGAGIGAVGGFFAGGPSGAMQGAQLGYGIGSQF